MSERKAYRVVEHGRENGLFRDRSTLHGDVDGYGTRSGVLQMWPENCPWDIEDFPVPGEEVERECGSDIIRSGPRYNRLHQYWVATFESTFTGNIHVSALHDYPSVWNARKAVKEGREESGVVAEFTIESGKEVVGQWMAMCAVPPEPGTYQIIRKGKQP